MDYVVRSWISGSISNDLADTILDNISTTRRACLVIKTQFLGNHETRALFLDA
jgi:hypothetical protein